MRDPELEHRAGCLVMVLVFAVLVLWAAVSFYVQVIEPL